MTPECQQGCKCEINLFIITQAENVHDKKLGSTPCLKLHQMCTCTHAHTHVQTCTLIWTTHVNTHAPTHTHVGKCVQLCKWWPCVVDGMSNSNYHLPLCPLLHKNNAFNTKFYGDCTRLMGTVHDYQSNLIQGHIERGFTELFLTLMWFTMFLQET